MGKLLFAVAVWFLLAPTAHAETRFKLLLFSTPWCGDCIREVPEIGRQLKQKLGEAYGDLAVTLYAETGKKAAEPPTEEVAAEMGKAFGVEFATAADPWRWQTFRKYFPTAALGIPASVVLDREGNVLKACKPESCTPEELTNFIAEKIHELLPPHSLYLVGEAATIDTNGNWLASSVYLIHRKVIPFEKRVEIVSQELGADKKVIRRTTLMKVTGNDYVVTDPQGSYSGVGSWIGTPWRWQKWKYTVKFPSGGSLEGNDELLESSLKMRKRYFDKGGKLSHSISADFSLVSQKAYEILSAKLAP